MARVIQFVPNPAKPGGRRAVALGITDRALRYRAVRNAPPNPRRCHYCGSRQNVEVEHVDGHEENIWPHNLSWACRSCNTRKGVTFRNAGIGRRTRQFNPFFGFGPKRELSKRASKLTIPAAMAAARRAGQRLGDTGLFGSWLFETGLDHRGERVRRRLQHEFEAAVESGDSASPETQKLVARYKGERIYKLGPGRFSSSFDPASEFESLRDAKALIDQFRSRRNNPAGAKSLGAYLNAVLTVTGQGGTMELPAAVELIHNTPHGKRSEFAAEIWARRHARSSGSRRKEEVPF